MVLPEPGMGGAGKSVSYMSGVPVEKAVRKAGWMNEKTNAMRVLERERIAYHVRRYELDLKDLLADRAAEALNMPLERVFKTLVAIGDRTGPMLVLVPAGTEVDLRLLAAASGDKRVEMAPQRDVLGLTGYERGAVTPLAMVKSYPVWIDETVELWEEVGISAGAPGVEILLSPHDLLTITGARTADIARSR
jgi:Cys-tRNA(Pro)/Cys-tRNA(Cys) deacylase